jgi:hypothetical protein
LTVERLENRTLLSFQAAQAFDAAQTPVAVAVGDFNGDGILDVVTAGTNFSHSVNLLLGNGDGTFQPPRSFSTNELPRGLAVGDFRHNGHLDVAIAGVQNVVVLLGNGDGTFQSPVYYFTGPDSSIAAGDFRGNGTLDLVVTNRSAGLVGVLQGHGDGTFENVRFFAAGRDPDGVAVGDFNEDGRDDIVVTNTLANQVSVLSSNGDGTFQSPVPYAVGTNPTAVAVGNFTSSGHRDLVVTDTGGRDGSGAGLSVLLGNGDGTFQAAGMINLGVVPVAVAVADSSGDGVQDLAVADEGHSSSGVLLGDASVRVLLGHGDGTFGPPAAYFGGAFGTSLAVGDFHRRGIPDIAVGNGGGTLNLLTGNGDGTFVSATSYASDLSPFAVAVGDFNGDGFLDIVTSNSGTGSLSLLFGNGDGTFQPPVVIHLHGSVGPVTVADLRHNGILDLVVVDSLGIEVLLGNGDGTFQDPVTYLGGGSFPPFVTVADLNRDGFPDLVSLSRTGVSVLLNNGDGTFRAPQTYPLGDETLSALAVGDFHHTGILDLVVTGFQQECDPKSGCVLTRSDINLFRGNGDGTFQSPVRQDVTRLGYPPAFLPVGDFNGDGFDDLVFGAHILLNNGDATFRDAGTFNTGSRVVYASLADINQDGLPDLVTVNVNHTVSILLGNGDGTFRPALNYAIGPIPSWVAAGDFNGDGFPDLVTANQGGTGSLTVLLNAADWGRTAPTRPRHPSAVGSNFSASEVATAVGAGRSLVLESGQSLPLFPAASTTPTPPQVPSAPVRDADPLFAAPVGEGPRNFSGRQKQDAARAVLADRFVDFNWQASVLVAEPGSVIG